MNSARSLWGLEDGLRFLNHGGYGAAPIEVLAEQMRWRALLERNPPRFFMHELPKRLREAAAALAAYLGTDGDRLGFVANASAGTNAVLRSLRFEPGDEIVFTDHIYNAVRNCLRYVAEASGARLVEAIVGMPVANSAQITTALIGALTDRTRLVVIDHVASASAVEFPVADIAALCRAHGIPLLIDGAHAPGLLDLDIDAIDADWYVGNCHKWLCAPKGAGFIALAARPTPKIHPLVISHGYGQGVIAEFDKSGTHDPTAVLAVPAALRFHTRLGGRDLRARNRALAAQLAQDVAGDLGTDLGATPDLFHAMATIRLPTDDASAEMRTHLQAWLYNHTHTEAVITMVADQLYLRISVQAYSTPEDFTGLAEALRTAIVAFPPPRL